METRRRITKAAASELTRATLWQSSAFSYQTTDSGTSASKGENAKHFQKGVHVCVHARLPSLSSQKCDLLITDLRLPEINGIELLGRARLIAPWVPVLIITGYGDVPTTATGKRL